MKIWRRRLEGTGRGGGTGMDKGTGGGGGDGWVQEVSISDIFEEGSKAKTSNREIRREEIDARR